MSRKRESPEVRKSESPGEELKAEKPKRKARKKSQEPGARNQDLERTNSTTGIPHSEIQNKSNIDLQTSERRSPLENPKKTSQGEKINKSDPAHAGEHPTSEITMEVQHHPEVEKKGLKEYILEGLMIFLAVTMGFFAETIRENITETSHAKELAKSLYKEVYNDSVSMQQKIKLREQKDIQLNYFRRYVTDSSLTNLSDKFYPSFAWSFVLTSSIIFDPNDGILNQLRNSGTLRYFKGIELQNAISRIDVTITNVRNRNSQEYAFVEEFTRPFLLKYYDFKWHDEYVQNGKLSILQALLQTNFHPASPPQIKHLKDFKRDDADALAAYYLMLTRATKQVYYTPYIEANHQLLQALRKEYHFKNE